MLEGCSVLLAAARVRWLALPLIAAVALVAACGGGGSGADGGGPLVLVSPDELQSYRYETRLKIDPSALASSDDPSSALLGAISFDVTISGEVLNPDRSHTRVTADLGFVKSATETIEIGDSSWRREDGGAWEAAGEAAGSFGADLVPVFSPADLFAARSGSDGLAALTAALAELDFEAESVNGLRTRHYQLDEASFATLFGDAGALLPQELNGATPAIDIWISERFGVPVRFVVDISNAEGESGIRIEMNILDINSRSIEIEAPA